MPRKIGDTPPVPPIQPIAEAEKAKQKEESVQQDQDDGEARKREGDLAARYMKEKLRRKSTEPEK